MSDGISVEKLLDPEETSLMVERLSQPRLRELYGWFQSKSGADRGMAFVRLAPIFDTSNFSYFFGVPTTELERRIEATAESLHRAFALGITFGLSVCRHEDPNDPFEARTVVFPQILEGISALRPTPLRIARTKDRPEETPPREPVDQGEVTRSLMEREPRIADVIVSACRMAELAADEGPRPSTGAFDKESWMLRFVWCVGILATGVLLPSDAAALLLRSKEESPHLPAKVPAEKAPSRRRAKHAKRVKAVVRKRAKPTARRTSKKPRGKR